MFDIYSNSRAVSQYLDLIGHTRSHGSVKVHRSQTARQSVDASIPTYKQVIQESLKSTRQALAEYKTRMDTAQKERSRMVSEMNAVIARDKEIAARILSKPRLVCFARFLHEQVKEKADQVIQDLHEQSRIYREQVAAKKREREIIISCKD